MDSREMPLPNTNILKERWENKYIFKEHESLNNNRDMAFTERLINKYLPSKETSYKQSDQSALFSGSKVYIDRYVESPPKLNPYKTSFSKNANHSYEINNPPHRLYLNAQNASGRFVGPTFSPPKGTDYSQPKLKSLDLPRFVSSVKSNHTKPLPMSFGSVSTGSKQFEYYRKSKLHDSHRFGPLVNSKYTRPLPMPLNSMSTKPKQFEYQDNSNTYTLKHSLNVPTPSAMLRRTLAPSLSVPDYVSSQQSTRVFSEKPIPYSQTSLAQSYSCKSGSCFRTPSCVQTNVSQQANEIANLDRPVSVKKNTQPQRLNIRIHSSTCITGTREDDCSKKSPTSSKTSLKNSLKERRRRRSLKEKDQPNYTKNDLMDNYESVKQDCSSKSCLKDSRDDRKIHLSETSPLSSKTCLNDSQEDNSSRRKYVSYNLVGDKKTGSSFIYLNDSQEDSTSGVKSRPIKKCVSYNIDDVNVGSSSSKIRCSSKPSLICNNSRDERDNSYSRQGSHKPMESLKISQEDIPKCHNESKEDANISVSKTTIDNSQGEQTSCCIGCGDSKAIRLKGNKCDVVLTVKRSLCSASEPAAPDSRNQSPYSKQNSGYCSEEGDESTGHQITQASYFDDITATYKTTSKHGADLLYCSSPHQVKQRSLLRRFHDFMGNIITPFTSPVQQGKHSISSNVPKKHKVCETKSTVRLNNRSTSQKRLECSDTNLSNLSYGNGVEYPFHLEDSTQIGHGVTPKQNAHLDRIIALARSSNKHSEVFKDPTTSKVKSNGEYIKETKSKTDIRHPLDGPVAKNRSIMSVEPPRKTAVYTSEHSSRTAINDHKDIRHPLDCPIPTKRSKVSSELPIDIFPDLLLVNENYQKHRSTSQRKSTSNRERYQNDNKGLMSTFSTEGKTKTSLKNNIVGSNVISGTNLECDSNKILGKVTERNTEIGHLVSKGEPNPVEVNTTPAEPGCTGNVPHGKIPLNAVFEKMHEEPMGVLRSNQVLSYSNNSPTDTEKCRVRGKSNSSDLTAPSHLNEKQDKSLSIRRRETLLYSLMVGVEEVWAVTCYYIHTITSLLADTAKDFRRYKQCANASKRLNYQPSPLCQPHTPTSDVFLEHARNPIKRKLCRTNSAKRQYVTEIEHSQKHYNKESLSGQQMDDIRCNITKQVQRNETYCVQLKRGGRGPELPWNLSPSEFQRTNVKVTQRPSTRPRQQDDTSSEESWGSF